LLLDPRDFPRRSEICQCRRSCFLRAGSRVGGTNRFHNGSDVMVLENLASALLCSPKGNIHHWPAPSRRPVSVRKDAGPGGPNDVQLGTLAFEACQQDCDCAFSSVGRSMVASGLKLRTSSRLKRSPKKCFVDRARGIEFAGNLFLIVASRAETGFRVQAAKMHRNPRAANRWESFCDLPDRPFVVSRRCPMMELAPVPESFK
jgi:hypothetical protein